MSTPRINSGTAPINNPTDRSNYIRRVGLDQGNLGCLLREESDQARSREWKSLDLPDPKQGAPKAGGAGFVLTNKTSRATPSVSLLPLEVIKPLAEIEPDNGIAGTMTLRLRFISKWSKRQSNGRERHDDRHHNEKKPAPAKTSWG